MRAIVVQQYGGTEHMIYQEADIPVIGEHEVLIRTEGTSVNFADIKARYGKKGGKLPFIPGLDAAGIVEQVGSRVERIQAGQRVIAFPAGGSYAEYVLAPENLTFVLPDAIDWRAATACPTVSFVAHSLLANVARLERGETVVIHAAAGGVGTTAIQLARLMGAKQVIGTVGNSQKRAIALAAGADHVVSYQDEDWAQQINAWTDGRGADVILDSVSGRVSEQSLTCLAPYGRLVQFGNSSGQIAHYKSSDLHSSCRSILGFSLGTTRKARPHLLQATAEQVFAYLASGQLSITIGREFPLAEAATAHDWVESRQSTGKVLLKVR